MKSYKTNLTFLVLFAFLFTTTIFAQQKGISKMAILQKMNLVEFENPTRTVHFFDEYAGPMGLSAADQMRLNKIIAGKNGYRHQRYQQFYKNIPVFGSAYTLHEKNGQVQHASGYYLPLIELNVIPRITKERALEEAMQKMAAQVYTWESEEHQNFPSRNTKPSAQLVIIDQAFPKSSEQYALAYQVDLFSAEPFDKRRYFVEAQTGQVLIDIPLLMHQSVPGQAVCKYYGEQTITVDSVGPNEFHLQDFSRNGNTTCDRFRNIISNNENYWDSNNENIDEGAMDAHYGTEKFHDFLLATFNWNGLGNAGEPMHAVVSNFEDTNASWNGEQATFYSGDCNAGPLTTLEVVAHEFMHGVTDYTSELVYQGESGAINESMSDVFGKALEYYEDPDHFNWFIGASFLETPYGEPFRSFEDPKLFDDPAMYQGQYWSDNGGVHTNSSIGNHWFYLLVNGAEGTNEAGYTYSIEGIGMDKAIQIAFLTQTTMLTASSTYAFYAATSAMATEELYGENGAEVAAVIEAWKAVGVEGETGSGGTGFDLALSFPELINYSCVADDYYALEITISNVGTVAYEPSMNALIDFPAFDEERLLIETILPGETVIITIDDVIYFDTSTDDFISVRMEVEDDNAGNNSDYLFVYNSYYENNDLSISSVFTNDDECFREDYTIRFRIKNESCNPIPAGTSMAIRLENESEEEIWLGTYELQDTLFSKRTKSYQENIAGTELLGAEFYNTLLTYEEDVSEENNTDSAPFLPRTVLNTEYLNPLDDLEDEAVSLRGWFEYETKDYLNESYLAVTGRSSAPGSLCPEPEQLLESAFYPVTLEICVDLQEMIAPVFGFDLIQFRNEEANQFQEIVNNTSFARASWETEDGSASFSELLIGLNEGELYNYEYLLPEAFKGKVKFNVYTHTGDIDADDFTSYDVALFDNLSFSDGYIDVSTQNIRDAATWSIQPNPSTGLFRVEYTEQPDFIVARNIHGQEVLRVQPNAAQQQLNLAHLPDGYYTVSLMYANKEVLTKLLTKVK